MKLPLQFLQLVVIMLTIQCQVSAADNSQQAIGVLVEDCSLEEDTLGTIREVLTLSKDLNADLVRVTCRDYISAVNAVELMMRNGSLGVIAVASSEALRIVGPTVKSFGIGYRFIATNNDWTLARPFCYHEAGSDSETWNFVTALLPDIIDRWQWRNLYLYVDEIFGLSEAKKVYACFEAYQEVANLKLIKTPRLMSHLDFVRTVKNMDNRGAHEVKAVIVMGNSNLARLIAKEASRMGMFSYSYRWLFLERGSEEFLSSLRLRVDTDVILMRHHATVLGTPNPLAKSLGRAIVDLQNSDGTECSVKDQPEVSMELARVISQRDGVHRLRTIGQWTPDKGLAKMKADDFPDLGSFELTVVTIDCPPYVFVRYDKGSYSFEGYMVDILNALSELMNFRYQIYVPDDATYGRCKNGTCSGLVGAMARGEADIALANMSPNAERLDVVDFATIAVDEGGLSLIMKRPKKSETNAINAYLKPFAWNVALLISFAVPLFGCLLWLGYRVAEDNRKGLLDEQGQEADPQRVRMNADNHSATRCLFAAMQSFAQQGVDTIPVTPAARAFFGVMWLFSVFIMSAYTANLISYFTATTIEWPFKSLQQLFNNRYYTVGLVEGTTYLDDIQGDNRTLLMKVWNRIEKGQFSALVGSFEEGKERIRKGRYALLHESRVIEHVVALNCEFISINEKYLSGPLTLVFRKDSEFTRPFSQMLLHISEAGLLVKLKRRWWPPAYDCSRESSFEGISLWAATSILAVLASGLFISFVMLAMENCVAAAKARKHRRDRLLRSGNSQTNILS